MARYIDADTMRKYAWNEIQKANKRHENDPVYKTWSIGVAELILALAKDMPTVDAVPVVRCRECVLDNTTSCPLCWIEKHTLQFVNHDPDFYCGFGERFEG